MKFQKSALALVAAFAFSFTAEAASVPPQGTVIDFALSIKPDSTWKIAIDKGQSDIGQRVFTFTDARPRTRNEWIREASSLSQVNIVLDERTKTIYLSDMAQQSPAQPNPGSRWELASNSPSQYQNQPAYNSCQFEVRHGDDTLLSVLSRWAKSAGWQEPQWTYKTVYVDFYATFCGEGGFKGAVERLVAAENQAGVPLFANFYSNNVVVIESNQ